MELIDLVPNSLSFRVFVTLDVREGDEVPAGFSGRVRVHDGEPDRVVAVAWYTDGRLHNPGRQHPAFRRFRPDGSLKYEMFYSEGMLHDPSPVLAAVRGLYADGSLHYEERYTGGQRHDGADGSAAIRKWRNDGTLRHELRYENGRRLTH